MNERIKKLARQVDACYIPRYDMWQMDTESLKNLAELIIRECASIVEAQTECLCDDKDFWSDQDYGYEMAVNDSVDMIKEYFEVVDKV